MSDSFSTFLTVLRYSITPIALMMGRRGEISIYSPSVIFMPSHDDDNAKACHLVFLSLSLDARVRHTCEHCYFGTSSLVSFSCVYNVTVAWRIVRACVRACVKACRVSDRRVIGALRSSIVRWCVTRLKSE